MPKHEPQFISYTLEQSVAALVPSDVPEDLIPEYRRARGEATPLARKARAWKEWNESGRTGTEPEKPTIEEYQRLTELAQSIKEIRKGRAPEQKEAGEELRKQARVLWNAGFGENYNTFEDYIATLPELPEWPEDYPEYLDRDILVDARLPLTKQLELLNIQYDGDDNTSEDYGPDRAKTGVYWMRAQDGKRNKGKTPNTCREEFAENEVGINLFEGVALFAQDREILKDHYMDLPGSVNRGSRGRCAGLGVWRGGPRLDWSWGDVTDGRYGAASRGE